jgi:hypothetical protein
MKPFKLLAAAVWILVWPTHEAEAQWVNVSGPSAVSALLVTPNGAAGTNLFAGTGNTNGYGGVFLSTDNGMSWTAVNAGLPGLPTGTYTAVLALAARGRNLFAGTGNTNGYGGVFLSTDNGMSWTAVNTGLTQHGSTPSVRALAVSGSNLFAGTYGGGVFLSTNNGTSWTAVNTGLTNTYVRALAVSPAGGGTGGTNLFAGTYGGGVFLSTNNGASWTPVNAGLTNTDVLALAVSGTNLFAGTSNGVFLSTDNGTSWAAVNSGLTYTSILCLAISGTNLFAGTYGGVFLSTNNGTSWTAVNAGLTNTDVLALAVSGTNLFAGTWWPGGVFRSTDNGASWTAMSTNLGGTPVNSLVEVPDEKGGANLFAGSGRGVFRSSDNGASWTRSGLDNQSVTCFAVSGTNLFAGTSGEGVFRSSDNGTTWSTANKGLEYSSGYFGTVYALAVCRNAKGGTNLFAGTNVWHGLFLSTNNGTSWTEASSGIPYGAVISLAISPAADATGGAYLFAGTSGGGVYRSTDNGTSWVAVNTGFKFAGAYGPVVNALAVCPDGTGGTNLFAATTRGVFLSTDNGTSWTGVNAGLTDWYGTPLWANALAACPNGRGGMNLFAGVDGGYGVFLSTNNGASWTEVNTGLLNRWVFAVAVSRGNLFAGTSMTDSYSHAGGVWRRPLSEMITAVKEAYAPLPEGYCLHQNYPNPFNPSTTIRFSLPKSGYVTLKVYDILGREVETLLSGERTAGAYAVEWTPNNLASGVYLYRIQAGAFSDVKRLVLLK